MFTSSWEDVRTNEEVNGAGGGFMTGIAAILGEIIMGNGHHVDCRVGVH